MQDAQNRAQRFKDFKINPDAGQFGDRELDDLRKGKLGDDLSEYNTYGKLDRSSNAKSFNKQDIDEYEAQYDPNNDFAIFGVGDQTRGGVQTMQEKMNLADDVK